jgi:ABC-type multidrug transport system fused ATPase/permease subunit
VAMAFLANWQFALLVAVGALITNLFFGRMVKSVKTASFKISSKGDIFTAYLIEAVHYFKYLKATNQFQGFSRKIKTVIDDTENLNRKLGHFQAITASIREPIVMIIVVTVIVIQIRWMGGNLGSILLSLLLFYRALSFLMNFQNSWQNFIQNVGAIESVTKLSSDMKAHKEIQNEKAFSGFKSMMEIKDLTFKSQRTIRSLLSGRVARAKPPWQISSQASCNRNRGTFHSMEKKLQTITWTVSEVALVTSPRSRLSLRMMFIITLLSGQKEPLKTSAGSGKLLNLLH